MNNEESEWVADELARVSVNGWLGGEMNGRRSKWIKEGENEIVNNSWVKELISEGVQSTRR